MEKKVKENKNENGKENSIKSMLIFYHLLSKIMLQDVPGQACTAYTRLLSDSELTILYFSIPTFLIPLPQFPSSPDI